MKRLAGAFSPDLIDRLFDLAAGAARHGDVPVAAACVYPPTGAIEYAANEVEARESPLAHAEILALKAMSRRVQSRFLTDAIVISTLEPCTMCMGAMAQYRVSGVCYFCPDEKAGYFSRHHIVLPVRGALHIDIGAHHMWAACDSALARPFAELLNEFFKKRR